ncbi:DUF6431 domain-containing protein [Youngiibacter fragilis]|jgi:hypothetical protein
MSLIWKRKNPKELIFARSRSSGLTTVMIIIAKYSMSFNEELDFFYLTGQESDAVCPVCGADLAYRDSRLRIFRDYGGHKSHILIRRLKCSCGRIHNELPDCLVPHKHYACIVIEDVLDEVSTPVDLPSEDYPCEATMERWKSFLERNTLRVEGILRSIAHSLLGYSEQLLLSGVSLVGHLRGMGSGWLSVLILPIYNSGHSLQP